MRLLTFITDAFGGRGGIAKFNRDLLSALTVHPAVEEVVALPRVIVDEVGDLPAGLTYVQEAASGKRDYARAVAMHGLLGGRYDGVICGHLNLLPLAAPIAMQMGAPLLLIAHGIEAWKPTRGPLATVLTRRMCRHVDALVTVSDVTRQRMTSWLPLEGARSYVVPNCIDTSGFGEGPKRDDLLARYGLAGRTVLLTVARLDPAERYKGVDEVLEILPRLATEIPHISYLICGDGGDRERLEQKAHDLGVASRVVFAGYIPEEEKADHYRLADAFVMPGRGEGFGIVYLEALACGVPVVASSADASHEAVLNGKMGAVVDPRDPDDVERGIKQALRQPRGVPPELDHFSAGRFVKRWHVVIDRIFAPESTPQLEEEAPAENVLAD